LLSCSALIFHRALPHRLGACILATSLPHGVRWVMSENKSYAASRRWPESDDRAAASATTADPIRSPEERVALAYRRCEFWLQRWLVGTFVSDPEVEEIVQEAFLRLHAVLVDGELIEHPHRWVSAVARNLALNQVRKQERERRKWGMLTQALLH